VLSSATAAARDTAARPAGRRRRDASGEAGGWSSAAPGRGTGQPGGRGYPGPRQGAYGPASGSYGAGGRGRRGVAQDLRDRLGVDGRGGQRTGTRPAGGSRAGGRYADQDYRGNGYGASSRTASFRDLRDRYDPRGRRGGPGYGGGPGGPRGPRRTGGPGRRSFSEWFKSGDWWRRWTLRKVLGLLAAMVIGVPLLGLVAFFIAYNMTPVPTDTSAQATAASSNVYYRNGALLGQFSKSGTNRQILTANQIPKVMDDAIIAAEDRHFYTEGGISVTGILRAAFADLQGGALSQGGSTLTEQFVKNYYSGFASSNNSDKNANDKLKQALVAIKLAHEKSKSWIITQYLNTVYLGENAYGVGAAAQVYFGEQQATQLTASQAAMLAALVNQPGYFQTDPHAGAAYTALVARWQYVLGNMVRDNALTQTQETQILKQGFPVVSLHFSSSLDGDKGYLMQMVQQELTSTYGYTQNQLDTDGLKITTTFSQQMQSQLDQSVLASEQQMRADGQGLPWYAHAGAVVENPVNGAIEAVYGGPGYGVKNCTKVFCNLNMAEDPKQVGSSFKPYVLATAVNQGMNTQSSVLNGFSPIWIPEGTTQQDQLTLSLRAKPNQAQINQQAYLPFNEPSENSGALSPTKAAAISSDPAFMDLAHRVGVQNIIDMAKQLGVGQTPFNQSNGNDWTTLNAQFGTNCKSKCPQTSGSVAIALGEGELTAVEQASMIATLVNDGVYNTPHVIGKIVAGSGVQVPLKVQQRQVLSNAAAADADAALAADNIPGGTAYPIAAWPGYQVIGKTGTTQTAQDAWFVGAIPQQAMAVTLFTNNQDSVSSAGAETLDVLPTLPGNGPGGGFGGEWPAYIWHNFMTALPNILGTAMQPQSLPPTDFSTFSIWNQVGFVPPQQQKHKHHGGQGQQPQPGSSLCAFGNFTVPCPPGQGQGGSPTQPVQPTPGPTCFPTPGNPCPQAVAAKPTG
jgi:membrane peptidoglycan carboxypeptidase